MKWPHSPMRKGTHTSDLHYTCLPMSDSRSTRLSRSQEEVAYSRKNLGGACGQLDCLSGEPVELAVSLADNNASLYQGLSNQTMANCVPLNLLKSKDIFLVQAQNSSALKPGCDHNGISPTNTNIKN